MSELSPRKNSNLKVTAHLHCLVIAEKEERTVRNLSLVMRSNFKAPEISLGIFKEQYNFGCTIEGMKQDILKNSVRYENRMLTYLLRKQTKNTLNVGESSKVEQSLTYFFFPVSSHAVCVSIVLIFQKNTASKYQRRLYVACRPIT